MKDILTSPRMEGIKRKRRMKRLRFGILVFLLAGALIAFLSYFSGNRHLLIDKVVSTGTEIIDNGQVEDTVRATISGKYIGLFTRANTLIYPKNKIYKNLIKAFPRIEKLSVYRDNWHTIHIDITERSGTSLYCGTEIPLQESDIGENCYFVNSEGYIFDKAPYFSGNIYFKYYMMLGDAGDREDTNPLGRQMLPPSRFHSIERLMDEIASFGFKSNYIVVDKEGDDTIYLNHNPGTTSPTIIFKDEDDPNIITDNLSLAMTKPEFANEIHSKYASLLYIDLRFENKVIYKFQ